MPSTTAVADYLVNYKLTSFPTPTRKGKGQKQESSQKLDMAFKKNGGKGWRKPNAHAKVGERATS